MTVKPWRRIYRDLNRDPRFTMLKLDYRTLYVQLLLELEDDGRLPRVPARTLVGQIADMLHIPATVVTKGLPELEKVGLLSTENNDGVHVVKFPRRQGLVSFDEEFQPVSVSRADGPKSAAERARAYRERKREQDSNEPRDDRHEVRDGERDDPSHDASRVSLRLPSQKSEEKIDIEGEKDAREPSRNERHEDRDEPTASSAISSCSAVQPDLPQIALASVPAGVEPAGQKPKPAASHDEIKVFCHWQKKLDHSLAKLDAKRIRSIRGALASHGLETCLRAIDGVASSQWHRDNKQDDIELILRDASHIEKYVRLLDRASSPPSTQQTPSPCATREAFEADVAERERNGPINYTEYGRKRAAALEARE